MSLDKLKSLDRQLKNLDSENLELSVPEGSEQALEIRHMKRDVTLEQINGQ